MTEVAKRYLTMTLLIRVKEIKAIVHDETKKLDEKQLTSLGGELALIDKILEELNDGKDNSTDKNTNIQS